ncbi:hypothetical protein CT19431_30079 [Cupriavidus taiwanensis]|nr:hypothetical protein CT19431_30079 [Cupriavidus taiwanensis]
MVSLLEQQSECAVMRSAAEPETRSAEPPKI